MASCFSFIRRRRVLLAGGGHYRVETPSFACVLTALGVFHREIEALRRSGAAGADPRPIARVLARSAPDRARAVLELCVDTDAPMESWPLEELAEIALALVDVESIAAGLSPSGVVPDDPDENDGSDSLGIVRIAERFHCAPHEVMEWPYAAVVEAVEALSPRRGAPLLSKTDRPNVMVM